MATLDDAKADARQIIATGQINDPQRFKKLLAFLEYHSRHDLEAADLLIKLEPFQYASLEPASKQYLPPTPKPEVRTVNLQPVKRGHGGNIAFIFLFLLTLAVALFIGFKYYDDQNSISSLNSQLNFNQQALSSSENQVASLQSKYPPKPFQNLTALQSWVNANMGLINDASVAGSGWDTVLAVQNKALSDGWMVSGYATLTSFGLQAAVGQDSVYQIGIGTSTAGNIIKIY